MVSVPQPKVIRDFARHTADRPEIEPDVIETLVDFKESYFDDPSPVRWRTDILKELMVGLLPRKVTAPQDWFVSVVPTVRAYLDYLAEHGKLAQDSDSARALGVTLDEIGDGVVEAAGDPRNFGMAKSIFSSLDFDPTDPESLQAAMAGFNALPDDQRAAILDPAMSRPGFPGSSGFPGADGRPAFDDPFDDLFDDEPDGPEEIWESLPPTWLPPLPELADQVRQSPLVQLLVRLADWVGDGRKVTQMDVLTLPLARRACADLGLALPAAAVRRSSEIPALHHPWSLASSSGFLDISGGTAYRGESADLLTDPDSEPEAVLGPWYILFASCLTWGLDITDDPDLDLDELDETVDALVTATLTQLYPGMSVPASGIAEIVETAVDTDDDDVDSLLGPPKEMVRGQVRRRWTAHLDQLVELGAVSIEDDELSLTPLGRAGLRVLVVARGNEAPVVDDPDSLDADDLLEVLPFMGEPVAQPLLAAWSSTRTPAQAVEDLLGAARRGTALTRMSATTVLLERFADHLAGAGRPHLEALREDPVLGMSAHVLLAGPDGVPDLPPPLRQWAVLESLSVAAESGILNDEDTAGKIWQMVDEDLDFTTAWRSTHPQLLESLDAVATKHPKGRTRKAAKKALFKARQRTDLQDG
jgi:hypothetical protein